MQVFFKDGSDLAVTEILGSRITGKDASGKYVDRLLKDVASFNGRVVFYTSLANEQYLDVTPPAAEPVSYDTAAIDFNNDAEEAAYVAKTSTKTAKA